MQVVKCCLFFIKNFVERVSSNLNVTLLKVFTFIVLTAHSISTEQNHVVKMCFNKLKRFLVTVKFTFFNTLLFKIKLIF